MSWTRRVGYGLIGFSIVLTGVIGGGLLALERKNERTEAGMEQRVQEAAISVAGRCPMVEKACFRTLETERHSRQLMVELLGSSGRTILAGAGMGAVGVLLIGLRRPRRPGVG